MSIEIELRKLVANCQQCDKQFIRLVAHQKFCCDNCRLKYNRKLKKKAKLMGRDLFAA
jgi:Zn finger protein HypA/HybF involved in hydrogenase expression